MNEGMKNFPGKEQRTNKGKQAGRAWDVSRTSKNVVGYDLFLFTTLLTANVGRGGFFSH